MVFVITEVVSLTIVTCTVMNILIAITILQQQLQVLMHKSINCKVWAMLIIAIFTC